MHAISMLWSPSNVSILESGSDAGFGPSYVIYDQLEKQQKQQERDTERLLNEDREYSRQWDRLDNWIGESSATSVPKPNTILKNLKDANFSLNCCRTSRRHNKAHLSPTTALHQKVLPGHNRSAISTHQIYFLAMSDHQPVRPRVAFAVAALTKPRD